MGNHYTVINTTVISKGQGNLSDKQYLSTIIETSDYEAIKEVANKNGPFKNTLQQHKMKLPNTKPEVRGFINGLSDSQAKALVTVLPKPK